MANKKRKMFSVKPKKKNYDSHNKGSKSIITNIYTYNRKKPKRLGRTCIHFNIDKLTCKLNNLWCDNADECPSYITNLKEIQSDVKTKRSNNINIVGVTTIALNDNRKCTNNRHDILDLNATIRIAQPNGRILTYNIPAAYCKECDTYFVLKNDYKIAKSNGKILCPIIDLTR